MRNSHFPKSLVELAASNFGSVLEKPGVYVVFWVRNGRCVVIPRILGNDEMNFSSYR